MKKRQATYKELLRREEEERLMRQLGWAKEDRDQVLSHIARNKECLAVTNEDITEIRKELAKVRKKKRKGEG